MISGLNRKDDKLFWNYFHGKFPLKINKNLWKGQRAICKRHYIYAALQLISSDGVSGDGVRLYRICVVYDNLQLRF